VSLRKSILTHSFYLHSTQQVFLDAILQAFNWLILSSLSLHPISKPKTRVLAHSRTDIPIQTLNQNLSCLRASVSTLSWFRGKDPGHLTNEQIHMFCLSFLFTQLCL
jgi:hypothetical protein